MAKHNNLDNITFSTMVRVRFFKPVGGKSDWYFGSLSAIYDVFDEATIGAPLSYIYKQKLKPDNGFASTPKCAITKQRIYRKKQKRKI